MGTTTADDAVTAALKSLPETPTILKDEKINQDAEVDMSTDTVSTNPELDRLQTLYKSAGYTDIVDDVQSLQNWEKSWNQQQSAGKQLPWMVGGLLIFAGWLVYSVGKDVFKAW